MFVSFFAVGLTVSETDDDIPLKKKKTDRLSGGARFLIKRGNCLKNHDIKTKKKKKVAKLQMHFILSSWYLRKKPRKYKHTVQPYVLKSQ